MKYRAENNSSLEMFSGKKPHRDGFAGKTIIAEIIAGNLKQTSNFTGDIGERNC